MIHASLNTTVLSGTCRNSEWNLFCKKVDQKASQVC